MLESQPPMYAAASDSEAEAADCAITEGSSARCAGRKWPQERLTQRDARPRAVAVHVGLERLVDAFRGIREIEGRRLAETAGA